MPKLAKTFNGNLEQALSACEEHLYIGNNLKHRGIIIFEIKDSSGKSVGIKLPKTWIPIDLMLFVDRESIKRSNSLRKLHRSGAIKFLDPTDSTEILKTKEAKEEAERAGLFTTVDFEDVQEITNKQEAVISDVAENSEDDEITYYTNLVNEIKGLQADNAEESEIVNKIKDMKTTYFSGEEVDKGKLILLLNDIKSFLSDAGKVTASEEVASFIADVNE